MRAAPLIALIVLLLVAAGVGTTLLTRSPEAVQAPPAADESPGAARPPRVAAVEQVPAAPVPTAEQVLVTVLRADSGAPVEGAAVSASVSYGWYHPNSEGTADAGGHCLLARQPVHASLTVRKDGLVPEVLPLEPTTRSLVVRMLPLGGVRGRVVDGRSGQPVAGQPVQLRQVSAPVDRTRAVDSGPEGTFDFPDVEPGRYFVYAIGAGRASLFAAPGERHDQVDVHAAAWTRADLRLAPALSVTGRVIDRAGDPIPGAEVRIAWWQTGVPVATAHDGSFRLEAGLPRDEDVYVVANAADYRESWAPLPTGDEAVELVLERARAITALVVDTDGAPVADATMQAFLTDGSRDSSAAGDAVSDEAGVATIDDISRGPLALRATKRGYAQSDDLPVPDGATPDDLTLVLCRGREIHGRLALDEPGAAMDSIRIECTSNDSSPKTPGMWTATSIDPDLSFHTIGLDAGTYLLVARGELTDGRPVEGQVEADAGERDVRLPLEVFGEPEVVRPPLVVTASVDGRRVDRARVLAARSDEHAPDFDASFPLRDGVARVPREVWYFDTFLVLDAADASGTRLPSVPTMAYARREDETLRVDLPAARTLTGRVTDGDGRPVAGVRLHSRLPDDMRFHEDAVDMRDRLDPSPVVTAPDGSFAFDDVLDAHHRVSVAGTRDLMRWTGFASPAESPMEIVLTPPPSVTLTFVDEDGVPVEGVNVEFTDWALTLLNAEGDEVEDVTSGPDGRALLRGVAAGTNAWRLTLTPPADLPLLGLERRDAVLVDETITLSRRRTITGVVRLRDGTPLPHVLVSFLSDGTPRASAHTDAAGRYEIDDAAARPGRLEAEVQLLVALRAPTEIAAAEAAADDETIDLVTDADDLLVLRAEGDMTLGTHRSWDMNVFDVAAGRRFRLPTDWSPSGLTLAAGEPGRLYDVFVDRPRPAHVRGIRAGDGVTAVAPAAPLARIEVRVRLDGRAPPKSVFVQIDDGAVQYAFYGTAGGVFTCSDVPAGAWRVRASARRGDVRYTGEARVTTGVTGTIDLAPVE